MRTLILALKQKRRITAFDITLFMRQFATLLTAGIPILRCCEMLENSQIKIAMRLLIYSIKRDLLSGKDVYSSLCSHPRYFDALTCQLISIGEHTGKLDITLQMIAYEHEKQLVLTKRIKQALFYPCIICITALLVTLSMFLFVIPRFAELFADTNVPLPALTLWLFCLSRIFSEHTILLFSPLFPVLLLFIPHPISHLLKNKLLLYFIKLPLLKQFLQKITLLRFARHLAMTFTAGIPIMDSLKLIMHSHTNLEFSHTMIELRSKMNSGLQLHQAMQSLPYFPDLMIQMVKTGEESGSLDALLNKTAVFFESDIDELVSQFVRLLEPLIMLVLGVLIGGLIIGMYLPIFKLGSVI
jgi:type IV pilus assembly protein PilC